MQMFEHSYVTRNLDTLLLCVLSSNAQSFFRDCSRCVKFVCAIRPRLECSQTVMLCSAYNAKKNLYVALIKFCRSIGQSFQLSISFFVSLPIVIAFPENSSPAALYEAVLICQRQTLKAFQTKQMIVVLS